MKNTETLLKKKKKLYYLAVNQIYGFLFEFMSQIPS